MGFYKLHDRFQCMYGIFRRTDICVSFCYWIHMYHTFDLVYISSAYIRKYLHNLIVYTRVQVLEIMQVAHTLWRLSLVAYRSRSRNW